MSDANVIKSSKKTPETPPEVSLLTEKARLVWDERVGLTVAATRHWRTACFASLLVAAISVTGAVYIGSQSKIQPYALALHENAVIPMQAMNALSASQLTPLYEQAIRDFVESSRSVVMDVQAERQLIQRTYRYLREGTPAQMQLTQQFKALPPFKRAETELVKVQIVSVLPLTVNSWQVEWTETVSDRNGAEQAPAYFKATLETQVIPPTTQAAIQNNPLGFFITHFNDVKIQ